MARRQRRPSEGVKSHCQHQFVSSGADLLSMSVSVPPDAKLSCEKTKKQNSLSAREKIIIIGFLYKSFICKKKKKCAAKINLNHFFLNCVLKKQFESKSISIFDNFVETYLPNFQTSEQKKKSKSSIILQSFKPQQQFPVSCSSASEEADWCGQTLAVDDSDWASVRWILL